MPLNIVKLSVTLCVSIILSKNISAQQSVNSSGATSNSAGGSVSYSVGQIDYVNTDLSGASASLGVQQVYPLLGVNTNEESAVKISVFPNPTTEVLKLSASDFDQETLTYRILDFQGKVVAEGAIIGSETLIGVEALQASNYLLNIVNKQNKQIATFKIIKK